MFGKKKKEDKKEEVVEEVKSGVDEASLGKEDKSSKKEKVPGKQEIKHELTAEEKELLDRIKAYKRFSGIFQPQDFANMPDTILRAEEQTLQFAILAELQDMNKKLDKMLEMQNVEMP